MANLLKSRFYYCTQRAVCDEASSYRAATDQIARKTNYYCPSCQAPLSGPHIRYSREKTLFMLLLLVGSAGITLHGPEYYRKSFPGPLSGISFSESQTTVTEDETKVTVIVRIDQALGTYDKPVTVKYLTEDGKARAGEDYVSQQGVLIFKPGTQEQSIEITLIPDSNYQEDTENFSIRLPEVAQQPHHDILILQSVSDQDALEKADILVRSASRIANEIAIVAVKIEVAKVATTLQQEHSTNSDSTTNLALNQQVSVLEKNLQEAKLRYAEIFSELKAIDANTVFQSIDLWIENLSLKDYQQQKEATELMRQHYESYLSKRNMQMDLWETQLSHIIPRVETKPKAPNLRQKSTGEKPVRT